MKQCTRDDVYAFINKAGLQGRTFGEIQRFVVEKNGLDYNTFQWREVGRGDKRKEKMVRKYRGYWCDNLYGNKNHYGHGGERVGILELGTIKRGKHYVSKKFADLV